MNTDRIIAEGALPILEPAVRHAVLKKAIDLLTRQGIINAAPSVQERAREFIERKYGQLIQSWVLSGYCVRDLKDIMLPEDLGHHDSNEVPQNPIRIQPGAASAAFVEATEKLRHASSYAAYLHWHMIISAEMIRQNLNSKQQLDERMRSDTILRLHGLAKHPFVMPEAIKTIEPLTRIDDQLIAQSAKNAVEEIRHRFRPEELPASVSFTKSTETPWRAFTSWSRDHAREIESGTIFICAMVVMALVAGTVAKVLWALLPMSVGLLGSLWLIFSGVTSGRRNLARIFLFASGFLLLYEIVVFVSLLVGRLPK